MAYLLNGTTLPNPQKFQRLPVEISRKLNMLNGATKKDIVGRKEQYILSYQLLTQAQMATINSIYNLNSEVTFQVTETNLTIEQTTVHMEISSRTYRVMGSSYLEDVTLVLTEVV